MKTHQQIIEENGGYSKVAEIINFPKSVVRFWHRRNRIPSRAWLEFEAAKITSVKELAAAAAAKLEASV